MPHFSSSWAKTKRKHTAAVTQLTRPKFKEDLKTLCGYEIISFPRDFINPGCTQETMLQMYTLNEFSSEPVMTCFMEFTEKKRSLQQLGDLPETKRTLPCKSWLWIWLWDLGGIIWLSLASGAPHSSAVDNKTSSLRLLSLRFKFRGLFRSFFHCLCMRMLHQCLMRPSTVSEMPQSYVQHITQGRNTLTPPMPTSLVSWLLGC